MYQEREKYMIIYLLRILNYLTEIAYFCVTVYVFTSVTFEEYLHLECDAVWLL
jgi:hypothetical protein